MQLGEQVRASQHALFLQRHGVSGRGLVTLAEHLVDVLLVPGTGLDDAVLVDETDDPQELQDDLQRHQEAQDVDHHDDDQDTDVSDDTHDIALLV